MPHDRPAYVPIDDLLSHIAVEDVARFYGVVLPELKRVGAEVRARCFLLCGKAEETGERALAIQADEPSKPWFCHQYGCGKRGNLVGLCDLLKPGDNAGGRPRGERFKMIADDLRAMAGSLFSSPEGPPPRPAPPAKPAERYRNVPLAKSENPRARELTSLDEKFLHDVARMPPPAASYFRRRPWLTEHVQRRWRLGYLPRDLGGDKAGGTMRGCVVYPLLSERGEVLTWFGRDPAYEEKRRRWLDSGRNGVEPEKFHFVRGFHRGLELFGQQVSRLSEPGVRETLGRVGLVVAEGPNDAIRLDTLGIPAVALLSNVAAKEQIEKIARFADHVARGRVRLMLDCDEEGENGARRTLYDLAQRCDVRLGWSAESFGGRFRMRQPESLSLEEARAVFGA